MLLKLKAVIMSIQKFSSYFNLLSCTFYFFKLLGVVTASLSTKSLKNSGTVAPIFQYSKLGILYNLLLIIFAGFSNSVSIVEAYKDHSSEQMKFEKNINIVQDCFALSTCILLLITFCIQQSKMIKVANSINSFRLSLLILNNRRLNSKTLRKEIVIVCFVVNLISWLILIATSSNNSFQDFFNNLSVHISIFIMMGFMTLYTIALKFIKYMYEVVNSGLREISSQMEKWNEFQFVNCGTRRMMHLQKIHFQLSNTTHDLSRIFSFPMLLCSINNFLTLILSSYYVAKLMLFGLASHSLQTYIHYFCHIFLNLLPLIILTNSVSATIFESRKAGKILSNSLEIRKKEFANTVELFLSYLRHSNVQFKVYDLFSLDQSLLISFVGSITTYLVIVLQFETPGSTYGNQTIFN